LLLAEEEVVAAEIDHLQRALRAKSSDMATISLQRHIALLKESQLKVELDKFRRSGKFGEAAQKAGDLERQTRLLGSYAFKIEALADEALDLYRQITELEGEELDAQLQAMRSELRQAMGGSAEGTGNATVLSRRIDDVTSSWLQKQSEVLQLRNKGSELSRAWRERFLGVQLR
jgi:predicted RNase H-like nuclease (RuvC/YqgF family)